MKQHGFTLIELLIVVAIISILAAIAVPNFLEAQTRSKVSRSQSDMRTLATGVESYYIDHNSYPPRHEGSDDPRQDTERYAPDLEDRLEDMHRLTTPIAYLTTLPKDVFARAVPSPLDVIDYWDSVTTWRVVNYWHALTGYKTAPAFMLVSVGPDGYIGVLGSGNPGGYPPQPSHLVGTIFDVYDATNGTISPGNIYRAQGNSAVATFR